MVKRHGSYLAYSRWATSLEAIPPRPSTTTPAPPQYRPYAPPAIVQSLTRWPDTPDAQVWRGTLIEKFIARVARVPYEIGDLTARIDQALYGNPVDYSRQLWFRVIQ